MGVYIFLVRVSIARSDYEDFYSPCMGCLFVVCLAPSIKFAGIHLYMYTWMERSTVRVKCLAREYNLLKCLRPRLEPRLLVSEFSTLTMKHRFSYLLKVKQNSKRNQIVFECIIEKTIPSNNGVLNCAEQ